eukprot:1530734-Rhodomonas_salina.1
MVIRSGEARARTWRERGRPKAASWTPLAGLPSTTPSHPASTTLASAASGPGSSEPVWARRSHTCSSTPCTVTRTRYRTSCDPPAVSAPFLCCWISLSAPEAHCRGVWHSMG